MVFVILIQEVLHILLQILEDGILTDSTGRKISLRNCLIFMTSNLGMHEIPSSVGFLEQKNQVQEHALQSLKKTFPPELINRIDEILIFKNLKQEHLEKIAERQLNQLAERLLQNEIFMEYDDSAVKVISSCPETAQYGARPVRRFLTQEIENPLSRMWLHGKLRKGDIVFVTAEENQLALKITERVH